MIMFLASSRFPCRCMQTSILRRSLASLKVVSMAASKEIRSKNVAVIGASRGIGLEFVKQLLDRGNTVHATARKPQDSAGLQQLASHQELSVETLDTCMADSIRAWAESLKGSRPFEYVFMIAGIRDETRAGLDKITAEIMQRLFETNAIGPLLVAQQLVKNDLLARGGFLVNMTSKMGSIGDNGSGGSYAYRASKIALNQITKSLSVDLEPLGVTAVLLHPACNAYSYNSLFKVVWRFWKNRYAVVGWVKTDMTEGRGLIDVEQSVSGLLSVLESDKPLNGRMYDYKHEEISW